MMDIKGLVKSKSARFIHYCDGNLWYEIEGESFEFPVPISDVGNATFLARDKAIMFMRYIRKHVELLKEAKDGM